MKKSLLKQMIKLLVFKQKEYSTSTGSDVKSNLDASIRQCLDNFFTKYYYNNDSIKIVKSINSLINAFVNGVLLKLKNKQDF